MSALTDVFLVTTSLQLAAERCPRVMEALKQNDPDTLGQLTIELDAAARTARQAFDRLTPLMRQQLAWGGVSESTIDSMDHIVRVARGRLDSQLVKQRGGGVVH